MEKLVKFEEELKADLNRTYRAICEEWKGIKQLLVETEAREAELKQQIIKIAGGERLEHGVKVMIIERTGNVDYKKLIETLKLPQGYVDGFRNPTKKEYRVTTY